MTKSYTIGVVLGIVTVFGKTRQDGCAYVVCWFCSLFHGAPFWQVFNGCMCLVHGTTSDFIQHITLNNIFLKPRN
jgi:hypothetical protein